MRLPEGLSYRVAGFLFKPGMECDTASWVLSQMLPSLMVEVVAEVRKHRDKEYMPDKEQACVKHMDHGTDIDDTACPCVDTGDEWECAHLGCGFCRTSRVRKQKEFGDAE